ncbi:MAG: DUF480 domain-containing protein [Bryobacterales bacterium]|nr:DUF480 domain-containing protein [Bryobacterales bacterium]
MIQLDLVEARVLGALIEKEMATPEYYPLSQNALVNACNQKSNRDPAMSLDGGDVSEALERLRAKGLASILTGGDNRVPKHSHRVYEALNLGNREIALLCVLMLRGPQTVGELRGRTQSLHNFEDLDSVEGCLHRLMEREAQPLVMKLPRQAGMKEHRYGHLFCGEPVAGGEPDGEREADTSAHKDNRFEKLEMELEDLRRDMDELRRQFADFRKQFE